MLKCRCEWPQEVHNHDSYPFVVLSRCRLAVQHSSPAARAITLPGETAIPVIFTHTIDSGKAKAGDVVTAKTMQVVVLPNGEQLAKGSLVTGHVVEARPFKFDETPYAAQQPSYLSIQIDHVGNEPVGHFAARPGDRSCGAGSAHAAEDRRIRFAGYDGAVGRSPLFALSPNA